MPGVVQHTQESLRKEVRGVVRPRCARGDAVRRSGAEGRARHPGRRPRRRGAGRAAQPARRGRRCARADGRRLPRRVHGSRTLRDRECGGRCRQRCNARPLREHRDRASRCRRRRDRAERHDGRTGRRDPRRARRDRSREHGDPRVRGQVRVRALRTVPRRGGVRAASSAIGAATRWIPPTRGRRSSRWRSTSPKAPTWS